MTKFQFKSLICFIIFGFNTPAISQNLIRNGSFELNTPYHSSARKWTIDKTHFDENMKYWTSPTATTPDIILDEYRNLDLFVRPGLDVTVCLPRTGTSVVAIRSFGCKTGTSHCREYLQAKTVQPLKKGCTYEYEFYAQPAVSSIRIDNLGITFNKYETNDITNYKMLKSNKARPHKEIIFSKIGEWVKVSGEYTMDNDYNYIIIGNFFNDDNTKHRKIYGGMRAAYYLIDDVSLSFKSCPNGISPPKMVSNTITLANILFEHDSAILKTSIEHVYNQIMEQSFTHIKIIGHTDESGTSIYNMELSKKRAQAVLNALTQLGLPSEMMTAIGLGSTMPLSTDKTELNRRVMIRIE